jgi:hypothetical protein
MRRPSVLFALVVTGCASTEDRTLAEIASFSTFELHLASELEPERTPLVLLLGYSPREPDDCPQLGDEVTATVDGIPLERVSRGHGEYSFGESSCSHPKFVIEDRRALPEPKERALFVISDRSAEWSMEVVEPFAPRSVTSSPATGGAGDRLELSWSPASDQLGYGSVSARRGASSVFEVNSARGDLDRLDDGFAFTIPTGVVSGPATLQVTSGASLPITRCDAGLSCVAFAPGLATVEVEIEGE